MTKFKYNSSENEICAKMDKYKWLTDKVIAERKEFENYNLNYYSKYSRTDLLLYIEKAIYLFETRKRILTEKIKK